MSRTATRNLSILTPSFVHPSSFSPAPAPLPVHKHDDHIFPDCIFLHFLL